MRTVNESAADRQGLGVHFVDAEQLEPHAASDDVDNRVQRADLVEVDTLNVDAMDPRLGFAETLENTAGGGLDGCRKLALVDESKDGAEGSVRTVAIGSVPVPVLVLVLVPVPVLVLVLVPVPLLVLMPVLGLRHHSEARARERATNHAFAADPVAFEPEPSEFAAQIVDGEAGVDEGSEDHVAARAAGRLEVGYARHQAGSIAQVRVPGSATAGRRPSDSGQTSSPGVLPGGRNPRVRIRGVSLIVCCLYA